jgi:hypothetical protein
MPSVSLHLLIGALVSSGVTGMQVSQEYICFRHTNVMLVICIIVKLVVSFSNGKDTQQQAQ